MADIVDRTEELTAVFHEANIAAVRKQAAQIKIGFAGECELCGELSNRLVDDACCRCRDKHKLP